MQIFFPTSEIAILLSFIIWPTIQITIAAVCVWFPDRFYGDSFWYRCHRFESSGKFYEKYFHIKRWKGFLPDGSAIVGIGMKKKQLCDMSDDNLRMYLIESRRAELLHLLAIPPFLLFGLFCPPYVLIFMFLYAVAVNLPCLIAQRYNRPRIQRILDKRALKNLNRLGIK